MKVLFVCSGNICRSPMAAGYFRKLVQERGLQQVQVSSAGTLGIEGSPASPEAVAAMGEIGVDLTSHRSRGVTVEELLDSDLVVVMAALHRDELTGYFQELGSRCVLLRAFENAPRAQAGAPDLEDPIGESLPVYRMQREQIVRCLDHLAMQIEAGADPLA